MSYNSSSSRGGAQGVWCVGATSDGKPWLANYGGESVGCKTEEEANIMYQILRQLHFGEFRKT